MPFITKKFFGIDIFFILCLLPIMAAGLSIMHSFEEGDMFFTRQLLWIGLSLTILVSASFLDTRFLKRSDVLLVLYGIGIFFLIAVLFVGSTVKGSKSWIDFGPLSFQPADFMKLVLILILSKYFSRRHVEIAHPKHIFISALYLFLPFALILLQPDFGSAIVLLSIWFGMALVSGISKKHLMILFGIGIVAFFVLWSFVFAPYQKARIMTFVNPLTDINGTGYNAYQSIIAVGSGQALGKGFGYGTQSRLEYLPEYKTDFIFAAFGEEWGFVGALILFICYGILLFKIISLAKRGASNFETLFCLGVAIFLGTHIIINIGMNIGLMPVTGIPLPLMSYGGSHLIVECMALGLCLAMSRYARATHRENFNKEFLGYGSE